MGAKTTQVCVCVCTFPSGSILNSPASQDPSARPSDRHRKEKGLGVPFALCLLTWGCSWKLKCLLWEIPHTNFSKVPGESKVWGSGPGPDSTWLVTLNKSFPFSGRQFPLLALPGGACGKEPACQCTRYKRCGFDPWVGEIPWRRAWQPTPVFLPGESLGQGSLAESDTT